MTHQSKLPNNMILHNYLYYNLDDISLFEQYLIISHNYTSKCSPDTTLLSLFQYNKDNASYHNVRNLPGDSFEVFNGKKWIPGNYRIIKNMTARIRDVICEIYNKFRFFITSDAIKYAKDYLYRSVESSKNYHDNNLRMRKYVGNASISGSTRCLPKPSSHVWGSLSSDFTWKIVSAYVEKLESMNVKLEDDATEIRNAILSHVEKNGENSRLFFKQLHGKIFDVMWIHSCESANFDPVLIKKHPVYLEIYNEGLARC